MPYNVQPEITAVMVNTSEQFKLKRLINNYLYYQNDEN